jgi:hypothetical protein
LKQEDYEILRYMERLKKKEKKEGHLTDAAAPIMSPLNVCVARWIDNS